MVEKFESWRSQLRNPHFGAQILLNSIFPSNLILLKVLPNIFNCSKFAYGTFSGLKAYSMGRKEKKKNSTIFEI